MFGEELDYLLCLARREIDQAAFGYQKRRKSSLYAR
jgi:hypothetical protein